MPDRLGLVDRPTKGLELAAPTKALAGTPRLPEGWEVSPTGREIYQQEIARFDGALITVWQARTAARGSTFLDAPDCREASRFLLTGLPLPRWKISLRIVAAAAFAVAGVMIAQGFNTPQNLLILIGGGALAVVVLILQETLLR